MQLFTHLFGQRSLQCPRSPPVEVGNPWDLDTPLLHLSPVDPFTLRDAFTQIHVHGSVGSGKSSGSISTLARAMLMHQFGILVCCAKTDEADTWMEYARQAGREAQVIRVTPDGPWAFNWLAYELRQSRSVEDMVHLIGAVTAIVEGRQTESSDPFWERSADVLIRNSASLLRMAGKEFSLEALCRVIQDAPQTPEDIGDTHWQETSMCAAVIRQAHSRTHSAQAQADVDLATTYFLKEFVHLAPRTRSSITATLTASSDVLRHGTLRTLLGGKTTFVPDMLYDGAILILDLPTVSSTANRIAQMIIKLMVQRAILRRNVTIHPRPVALFLDESQNFVTQFDWEFLAMCRSSRCANVYGTQSISNYHAKLRDKDAAAALLSLFQVHIFHRNMDHTTNTWAADLIAQQWMQLLGTNMGDSMSGPSHGANVSQSVQYKVLPGEFAYLRSGGPANDLKVDAYIVGKIWNATRQSYMKITFTQR